VRVLSLLFEKKMRNTLGSDERNEKTSSQKLFRAGEIEKREKFSQAHKFPYTHAASFATHTTTHTQKTERK